MQSGHFSQTGSFAESGRDRLMAMKWYVVHTYSGHENKAKLSLLDRVRQAGLAGEVRRRPDPDRHRGGAGQGPEAVDDAQVLPRLHLRADGPRPGDLPPGQEHAQDHRLPGRDQPQPVKETEIQNINVAMTEGRLPPQAARSPSRRPRPCGSSTGRSRTSPAPSSRSRRRNRRSASTCRSSAAPRRSSWISRRSRKS